ncbi:MAG: flagellar basal body-associated FliL family protein [Holophagales bacterium]|nr:flagellar basal body-associated FliL family protein [Holophagales bacterium]
MDIKKILMFGGIGLAVIGGGGFYFLNKPSVHESDEHESENPPEKAEEKSHASEPPPQKASTTATDPAEIEDIVPVIQTHIVNMPGGKGGFLKCQISIMVRDPELGEKMNAEAPSSENMEAKAIVLDALTQMTEEDIFDHEAQLIFRENITNNLNERIKLKPSTEKKAPPRPSRPFKDVLITEWAVQR